MNAIHVALRDLFDQTLAELQNMRLVLEHEITTLKGSDAKVLEHVTKQKERLANSLDKLIRRQEDVLRAHKLPAGKEGIERILSMLPPSDPAANALHARWQEIKNLTSDCQKLNEVNGAYIGLLRQHVQRSLDIIHGQSSHDVVYGPDGVGHRTPSSRKLLSV